MWQQLNDWFGQFAAWCQRVIASPLHFALFLAATAIWLVWAITRSFDPFSQLVANTPTTLAEYLFEILVLAAALSAERKAHAADRKADRILEELRALLREVRCEQSEVLEEESEALSHLRHIERALEVAETEMTDSHTEATP